MKLIVFSLIFHILFDGGAVSGEPAAPVVIEGVPSDDDFYRVVNSLIREGKTLAATLYQEAVLERMTDPVAHDRRESTYQQNRLYAGQWREAVEAANRRGNFSRFSASDLADPALLDRLEPRDAIAEIVGRAKDRQIVILNESHNNSEHRHFAKRLALALREVGFTWLAVEAFNGFDIPIESLRERGYPVRADGGYLSDPFFADFIRSALGAGFRPVRYEINTEVPPVDTPFRVCDELTGLKSPDPGSLDPRDTQFLVREKQQACNIYLRVFKQEPDAKIFIHVGHGHLWENLTLRPDGVPEGMMGAFLKAYTGLDPLTIDQTHGSNGVAGWSRGGGNADAITAGYAPLNLAILEIFSIERPTVFRKEDSSWLVSPLFSGRVDMTLYRPPLRMVYGRPAWLEADPDRRPVRLSPFPEPAGHPLVIEAVDPREGPAAIPVDQVFDQGESGDFTLFLPHAGTFAIRLQCPDGDILDLGAVSMEGEDGGRFRPRDGMPAGCRNTPRPPAQ